MLEGCRTEKGTLAGAWESLFLGCRWRKPPPRLGSLPSSFQCGEAAGRIWLGSVPVWPDGMAVRRKARPYEPRSGRTVRRARFRSRSSNARTRSSAASARFRSASAGPRRSAADAPPPPALCQTPRPFAGRQTPEPSLRPASGPADPAPAPGSASASRALGARRPPPARTSPRSPHTPPESASSALLPGPAANIRRGRSGRTLPPCTGRRVPPSTATPLPARGLTPCLHTRPCRCCGSPPAKHHLHVRAQPDRVVAALVVDHQFHGHQHVLAVPEAVAQRGPWPAGPPPRARRSARSIAVPGTRRRRVPAPPPRRPRGPRWQVPSVHGP